MMRTVLVSLLLLAASAADGALSVVASTSNMGMLARTVGGDFVKVTVLAPPDRDPHTLQARPSMMLALRGADLLVAVGAELEVGWLPAGLSGASNPRILPGQPGYFEAAAQIPLIEKSAEADRSRGDVHPMGNPHVFLDPERMAAIARALGGRLGQLDPAHAAAYGANAEAFGKAVAGRVPGWKAQAAGTKGAVLYHKDANYLFALLGVPVLGYVEPLPGIPPTAQHLSDLVARLTGTKGVVLYTDYQPSQGPDFVAGKLGWKAIRLPIEAGPSADAEAYFRLIDRWVDSVAQGR
ncbi:MAG TPA: zinc ABC transporter substrate-binding protein [Thermoanaerobaculia bacterium]|nr:zinc ABC transporter substrate-binding protein [Thermoanaerobaculia bacterium]HQR67695.1 zinc ABC transporter substrate-binding protein [Thermoanaerobaculia bacterium]